MTLGLAKAGSQPKGGPLIWWKLDEQQGVAVANATSAALSGEVHGDAKWAPGKGVQGGALELSGQRNWIEAVDSAKLDFQGGLTVATWFKVKEFKTSGETLLAKGDAWRLQRVGKQSALEFFMHGPMTPKQGALNAKSVNLDGKRKVDDGQWHHVAVTYDGQKAVLYLDGTEEASVPATGLLAANNIPITAGDNHKLRGRCFNGWLDDTQVYDRGLSADEIKALAVKGKGLAKQ